MNPKVDFFFEKPGKWQKEYNKLRNIILTTGISEELKWGHPCYTYRDANVVLIHGFKDYCAVLFHKGVLLKDTENILIQQTENVQAARQIRFTGIGEIIKFEDALKSYVFEAIEIAKVGLTVELKKTSEFPMAEEFKVRLENDEKLKTAFEALTPGRQRGYLLHFSKPKQAKTRESRIEKAIPAILECKGLNDLS